MKNSLGCLRVLLSCVVCLTLPDSWAQEQSARAREILSAPAGSAAEAREALLDLGDAAIEPVVEALAKEEQAAQPRQVFLVGILASLRSPNSNRALGRLLDDRRALVRANAASALGRNHEVCAVPRLVRLLADDNEYAREVSTDPHREKPMTVSATASRALETVTSVHSGTAGDDGRAKRFERWWDRKKGQYDCANWN
jgi:hypothetical protein